MGETPKTLPMPRFPCVLEILVFQSRLGSDRDLDLDLAVSFPCSC